MIFFFDGVYVYDLRSNHNENQIIFMIGMFTIDYNVKRCKKKLHLHCI